MGWGEHVSDSLRIAIFTWDIPEANVVTNRVLENFADQVVGVVNSRRVHRLHRNAEAIRYLYGRSGGFFLAKMLEFGMLPVASLAPKLRGCSPRTQPLRSLLRSYGLKHHSTSDINSQNICSLVASWKPDLLVSIYMNQLFESELLSTSRIGTINVHPSLLPKHRGMAPYVWAAAEGDSHTGVTVHWIDDERLDQGDIISQRATPITPGETALSLAFRCADIGAEMMVEALQQIGSGRLPRSPQDHDQGSYHGWPDRDCLKKFANRGHVYLTLRDMWRELTATSRSAS